VFSVGYDSSADQVYYSCNIGSRRTSLNRYGRSSGPKGMGGNATDEVVYSGIFYEFPPRSDKGASKIAGITIDDVNKLVYVATYHGNSAQQSVLMLPLPEHGLYPGRNEDVHRAYWPMDLVSASDAPIACLYGHESIPHSSGYGNRKCEYQGERLPWTMRTTGMDVILPNPEGIRRFYITETSGSLAVLPQKPSVLESTQRAQFDWSSMFDMLPHAAIKTSKTKGWSYTDVPVTASDLGWQPTHHVCAELCATFWRKGGTRCIGFNWNMANNECEALQHEGKLPNLTRCAFSNSGLACLLVTVPLDDPAADDFTAWPHPCFTMPIEDADGNPWVSGAQGGYAPAGGWPSYVEERYIGQMPERGLVFLMKPTLFEDSPEGANLRSAWRAAVPAGQWYGSTDHSDRPRWPGDLGNTIFATTAIEQTNPAAMPSAKASCFAADAVGPVFGDGDSAGSGDGGAEGGQGGSSGGDADGADDSAGRDVGDPDGSSGSTGEGADGSTGRDSGAPGGSKQAPPSGLINGVGCQRVFLALGLVLMTSFLCPLRRDA